MLSDTSVVLSTVQWSDSSHQLQDFNEKYEFPQIGKISKGQYANIGAPSLSSPSLNQIVLWGFGGKRVNVIAQSVRFKESRNASTGVNGRAVPVGPKLVIPDNYDGWWEILSEEGKSVRCIESVSDLAKRCPDSCLVRENIKAHIGRQEDPNQVSEKVRTIQSGELLTLLTPEVISVNSKSNAVRYVKSRSSKGDIVYLSYEQKGKFSPVAKEGISGVHTIANLLSKRLPLMVRLVYGRPPQGYKSFCSDVRLFSTFEEDCVVAMPLIKDTQTLTQVPISSGLKILGPKNGNELCELTEFCALKDLSKQLLENLTDKIHLLDSYPLSAEVKACLKESNNSIKSKLGHKLYGHHYDHKQRLQSNFSVKRSSSDPQQLNQNVETNGVLKRGTSLDDSQSQQMVSSKRDSMNNENDRNNYYDEIDQIYDYVRGFAPLPQSVKSEFEAHKVVNPLKISVLNCDNKPEPPPIINIPSIQNQRMSYPMASNKMSVNVKKVKKYFPNRDQIFGKNNNKSEVKANNCPNVRYSYPNNNSPQIYLPTVPGNGRCDQQNNGPKLFVKHSSGQRNTWKCNRFLKYAKHVSSPFRNEIKNQSFDENGVKQQKTHSSKGVVNQTCRSSRSLTTSPIFNIRYKSMNNLNYITPPPRDYNNTLESSHSGGTSSGSGSKELFRDPKSKLPKLSRSLNNIFWDITGNLIAIETINKLNNELNEKKNMTSPQLLPVHIDFLNALDKLQQQNQHNQQLKDQSIKSRQMATLYL